MNVRQTAVNYLKLFNSKQKERLKAMLNHGIQCGNDFAIQHGIEPVLFNNALKDIFGGEKNV